MSDGPKKSGAPASRSIEQGGAAGLAVRALSVLSAKGSLDGEFANPKFHAICDAFVDPDEALRHEVIETLQSNGMSTNEIVDFVIPRTAQLMGDRWFADKLSFADVTIGAARLQETVRSLNARHKTKTAPTGDRVLLIVPRNEHHTLGIFVLSQQLRRRGIDVQLAVGMFPRQISELVKKHHFQMVGITTSGRRTLAAARELVDIVRNGVSRVTPVAVGGGVLSLDLDVKALTGCDYLCNDPDELIRAVGLKTSPKEESVDE